MLYNILSQQISGKTGDAYLISSYCDICIMCIVSKYTPKSIIDRATIENRYVSMIPILVLGILFLLIRRVKANNEV